MSDDVERYLSNLRTEAANMGEAGKDREQELLIKEIGRLAFDIRGTSEIIRQRLLYLSQHVAVQSPEKHQALSKVYASWASDVPPAPLPDPPASACSLLDRLLPRSDRNVIRGDMEEEFKARLVKHGPTHARRWFWRETAWTIVQQNPVCRSILVGGLMRVGEWIFRQIGG